MEYCDFTTVRYAENNGKHLSNNIFSGFIYSKTMISQSKCRFMMWIFLHFVKFETRHTSTAFVSSIASPYPCLKKYLFGAETAAFKYALSIFVVCLVAIARKSCRWCWRTCSVVKEPPNCWLCTCCREDMSSYFVNFYLWTIIWIY